MLRENLVSNVSRRSRFGLLEVDFLVLWYQLFSLGGEEERGCRRFWIPTQLVCPVLDLVAFIRILQSETILVLDSAADSSMIV